MQEDIDRMEEMASDMETQEVVDFEQLICTGTDNKAPEVNLLELSELPRLNQFHPSLPLDNL